MDRQSTISQRSTQRSNTVYLVGCGGVGSWLAQALSKTLEPRDTLILIDGDVLTEKNLDRQLFPASAVGKPKSDILAETLRARCTVKSIPAFFTDTMSFVSEDGIWFVAVDNHPARLAVLHTVDVKGRMAFFAANEYRDAEAYVYYKDWRDTKLDPRSYYPEILTDHTGDPLSPCTGEAQVASPQLAISNMAAATYSMWLYWFWTRESDKLDCDAFFPVKVSSNFSKVKVTTKGDLETHEVGTTV